MMTQSKSNSPIGSRADWIGLDETDYAFIEQEILEEDPAQIYHPSQERIRRMCRLIRSSWSEDVYLKRSSYKPVRWLVSVVSVNPDTMTTLDE
jgi:hypothetical protein